MLSALVAHQGQPLERGDLWTTWHLDPLLLGTLALAALVYAGGLVATPDRRETRRRATLFGIGLLAVAVALVSPLDALAGSLASAHMVQHVLLIAVAAPLLALTAPVATAARGIRGAARGGGARIFSRLEAMAAKARGFSAPLAVALLHAAAIAVWHASVAYDAALQDDALHMLEHGTFFASALLFWSVVVGAARAVSYGHRMLLVFGIAMESVFLGVLMTFATEPWYDAYATTTARWGMDRLADQQLAGLIMWIPAGGVYLAAALILLATWMRAADEAAARYAPFDARSGRGS